MKNKYSLLKTLGLALAAYLGLLLLLVYVEQGAGTAGVNTLQEAFRFSVVTLTTVGYGAVFPVTLAGKIIGLIFVVGSLGVLGLLVTRVTNRVARIRKQKRMGYFGTDFEHHMVIVGWDAFAQSVAQQLLDADKRIAVVTDREAHLDLIHEQFDDDEVFVLLADLKDAGALEKANAQAASGVLINLPADTDTLIALVNLKDAYPSLNYIVTLENYDLQETFRNAGAMHVLCSDQIAAKLAASYIFEPDVAAFSDDLLGATETAGDYDIQQYEVTEGHPFAGKSFGEVFAEMKRERGCVPIGLSKESADGRELLKLPSDDVSVAPGDYLVLILDGGQEEAIRSVFGVEEGQRTSS